MRDPIASIVESYEDLVIRMYARIRFLILRQPFLEEIGQYLPANGRILDLGCGFGLFSLYFASLEPGRRLVGVDRNPRRIALSRVSARKLGIENAEYHVDDALEWQAGDGFEAIYMLDLVHHLPADQVPSFLARIRSLLRPGGILIIKDVMDRPWLKRMFTLALDRLIVGWDPIKYWPPDELSTLLQSLGLDVKRHRMRDYLPYPHILYICRATS